MGQKEDIVKTENKIIVIRDKQVILDRDVAELYGVETRRINEALKNNPDKFPDGYVIELTNSEKEYVVENFDHLKNMKYSHAKAKAFTEKGLYMLATILKSPLATEVTIAIIETFSKVREVSRAIAKVNDDAEKGIMPKEEEQGKIQNLMGEVLADNLPLKMRKMAFSLNLGFLKVSVETTRWKDIPLLLCAIKLVFVSSLRLDVTDRLEPEIREIFSSALLISEKCSDVSGFLFKSF